MLELARPSGYVATGKTIIDFHADRQSTLKFLRGPIGSGKSVACCWDLFLVACFQAPDRANVRRTRFAVIRNTYAELKTTTIKTWQYWFPENICPIVYDSPIRGHMRFPSPLGDGTTLDIEVLFFPLDKPSDITRLLSMEYTAFWVNEGRELSLELIINALSRCGRYPNDHDVKPTWYGGIIDSNSPDSDHWWPKNEASPPETWRFFVQPGGLRPVVANGRVTGYEPNPDAENVANLPGGYGYWMKLIPGNDPEWIKIYLCGQYGNVFSGRPVYDGIYQDTLHWSPTPLAYYPGLPLRFGWDFGLTPACIVFQLSARGQVRVLREYAFMDGGLEQFVTQVVIPGMANDFAGARPRAREYSKCDPAGAQRGQANEVTCVDTLNRLGFPTQVASTNDFAERRGTVIKYLTRLVDKEPGLILDPSCKILRAGFMGGYQFKRIAVVGEERYRDVPEKNSFSHLADALQYALDGLDTVRREPLLSGPPINTWGAMT